MANDNLQTFGVFCPDGFVPRLTLCALTDGEDVRGGIQGSGSKAEVFALLSMCIATTLGAGLSIEDVTVATSTAITDAKRRGVKVKKGQSYEQFEKLMKSEFDLDDEDDEDDE